MGLLATLFALTLTLEAPPSLASAAQRVRAIDRARLEAAIVAAGLDVPDEVQVALVAESEPEARRVPNWLVGQAFGTTRILIFPDRVTRYPYDSLESVVRHEVVHLALTTTARGWPLPRWFHEGVATSVDAGWGVGGEFRLLVAALSGPSIDDVSDLFESESQQGTELAYLLSAALVSSVRERHGANAPGRIATGFAGALHDCIVQDRITAAQRCAPAGVFARAFLAVTGETPATAAAIAWRSYRGGLRWIPAVVSASAMWTIILALALLAFVARRRRRALRRQQWAEEERGARPSDSP